MTRSVLMLEDNAERVERSTATLHRLNASIRLMIWRNARKMVGEIGDFLASASRISLDRDLEPEPPEFVDPGDGLDVAKWLAERQSVCPVIIHTSNGVRGDAMEGELALASWRCRRVMPLGDDWIEVDWLAVARKSLRQRFRA